MTKNALFSLGLIVLLILSCSREEFDQDIEIPEFNFHKTIVFEDSLSAYQIFEGSPNDLVPAQGFEVLELSSILFTDFAYKQRLIKIPAGGQVRKLSDNSLEYPNGTILTKTFYYFKDERDITLGKRIIETRLEIKEFGTWNIATYTWNEHQTDAVLELQGLDTEVNWINKSGQSRSTLYHVPDENECMTCHQAKSKTIPIGPTLVNLNRDVERSGVTINQLSHLQNVGFLSDFPISQVAQMPDYKDLGAQLDKRGRAYLAMNCAHCHNPNSWERAAEREFDFRFETPFSQARILFEEDKIKRAIEDGEMPLIGTTLIDEEGVDLLIEYIESL